MSAATGKDKRQWFLRVGDNTVFGPVSTQGLIVWAEEGRIASGNEVSQDRKQWVPPESVPELEIRWYVRDASGNPAGPFNRKAIERLIMEGKIPPDTDMLDDQEAFPGKEPAAASLDKSDSPGLKPLPPSLQTVASASESDELQAKIASMERQVEKLSGENKELQRKAAEKDREDQEKIESLETELGRLQRRIGAMQIARSSHRSQQAELENQRDALRAACEQSGQKEREAVEALEAERSAHAETLRFANERDAELMEKINTLSARSVSSVKTVDSAAGMTGDMDARTTQSVAQIAEALGEQIKGWAEDEEKRLRALNALAANRHDTLLRFMRLLRRPLSGGDALSHTPSPPRTPGSPAEYTGGHEEWRTREEQLLTQIRKLEAQKTSSERDIANEKSRVGLLLKELADRLQLREKELAEEKEHRESESARAKAMEDTLSQRIEDLESAAGSQIENRPDMPERSLFSAGKKVPSNHKELPDPKESRKKFRPTPWMRLK